MDYFLHLLYGTLMAYFGLLAPGMLNMTALKTRLHAGTSKSLKFALGASTIVVFQAFVALFFADYFLKNPEIISKLKGAAVVVFFILSIVFFLQAKKNIKTEKQIQKGNYFFRGLGLSLVNMLAIPFYFGTSVYLASVDKIILEQPFLIFFAVGAALGSFLIFYTYILFANFIIKKIQFIVKNINYILSLLFLCLGIYTLVKLLL